MVDPFAVPLPPRARLVGKASLFSYLHQPVHCPSPPSSARGDESLLGCSGALRLTRLGNARVRVVGCGARVPAADRTSARRASDLRRMCGRFIIGVVDPADPDPLAAVDELRAEIAAAPRSVL